MQNESRVARVACQLILPTISFHNDTFDSKKGFQDSRPVIDEVNLEDLSALALQKEGQSVFHVNFLFDEFNHLIVTESPVPVVQRGAVVLFLSQVPSLKVSDNMRGSRSQLHDNPGRHPLCECGRIDYILIMSA